MHFCCQNYCGDHLNLLHNITQMHLPSEASVPSHIIMCFCCICSSFLQIKWLLSSGCEKNNPPATYQHQDSPTKNLIKTVSEFKTHATGTHAELKQ